jgi:hypothetical protein
MNAMNQPLAGGTMTGIVEVGLSALTDLAVDCWRLQHWAFVSGHENERVVARQVSRALSSFLSDIGLETRDLTGQPYDAGLSVEVVDAEEDASAPNGSVRIQEMIAPIVLRNGELIRGGQVALSRGPSDQEAGK